MDMTDHNILIHDDCECCHYIMNAFQLLRLPLAHIPINELDKCHEKIGIANTLITCANIEAKHAKSLYTLINQYDIGFISCSEPSQLQDSLTTPPQYLKMPFSRSDLTHALSRTNKPADPLIDTWDLKHPIFGRLLGTSKQIRDIRSMIMQVADSDSTVLILGQSGTGKDVIASCIHTLSKRADKPFVPINCGAIPAELMESELFGHEKGAFTGALTRRAGRFEIADTGTLFLDEIGDMPLHMQVKLLRVLQDRIIERVGSISGIKVDVRIIAATNKNLLDLIQHNQFREDLFYRLNVFPIHVPRLCDRKEDIPLLIDYHLDKIQERLHHRVEFNETALEILSNYSWPGNIRELENFLERMVILHRDEVVCEKDIDAAYKKGKTIHTIDNDIPTPETPFNIKEYIAKIEEQMISTALERTNGAVGAAAEYLSLGKSTLVEKMKKYNLVDAES